MRRQLAIDYTALARTPTLRRTKKKKNGTEKFYKPGKKELIFITSKRSNIMILQFPAGK